jgi:hypothetical protein
MSVHKLAFLYKINRLDSEEMYTNETLFAINFDLHWSRYPGVKGYMMNTSENIVHDRFSRLHSILHDFYHFISQII